jgi:hypothetical protein
MLMLCAIRRTGCHALALDLVSSWSFDRPSTVKHEDIHAQPSAPPSPTASRFALAAPSLRRASSIMIDMDIPTAPPTRRASPTRDAREHGLGIVQEDATPIPVEAKEDESDLFARKAGLGSLMKTAKSNVQVPDFDMDAFF